MLIDVCVQSIRLDPFRTRNQWENASPLFVKPKGLCWDNVCCIADIDWISQIQVKTNPIGIEHNQRPTISAVTMSGTISNSSKTTRTISIRYRNIIAYLNLVFIASESTADNIQFDENCKPIFELSYAKQHSTRYCMKLETFTWDELRWMVFWFGFCVLLLGIKQPMYV